MPRRSVADAQRTREAIVARAVEVATTEGLDGVTLGRLADDLGMSKAGVIGHFGTKEALQLAAIEAARATFIRDISVPEVLEAGPGLPRLVALCDAWISNIAARIYPGGCFWAATSVEFDAKPGPVRDAVAATLVDWDKALARAVREAVEEGHLPAGTDVAQVVFELRAIGLGLNQELQMHANPAAERRARRAVRRAMGRPELSIPRSRRSRVPA